MLSSQGHCIPFAPLIAGDHGTLAYRAGPARLAAGRLDIRRGVAGAFGARPRATGTHRALDRAAPDALDRRLAGGYPARQRGREDRRPAHATRLAGPRISAGVS